MFPPVADEDGSIIRIDDIAGQGAGGLFDKADFCIVNLHIGGFSALRGPDGKSSCQRNGLGRRLFRVAAEQHMAAVMIPDMEPEVIPVGGAEGQLIILGVIFAGVDVKAVR